MDINKVQGHARGTEPGNSSEASGPSRAASVHDTDQHRQYLIAADPIDWLEFNGKLLTYGDSGEHPCFLQITKLCLIRI